MVQAPSRSTGLSLELPVDLTLTVTQTQFELLAVTNRDLRLERTCTGELIIMPPTGWETGERNFSILSELGRWHSDHYDLGKCFESSTGFILPNGATRSPDASWISQTRWNALRPEQKITFPNICPDFIVELRSATDALRPTQEKMEEYMANGSRLGWLIDPQNKRVEIYREGQEVEVLDAPVELSGEAVLPGLVIKMHRIWS